MDQQANRVMVMVFNATSYNISVISWRSVLLVEEIGASWEYHRPAASHWQTVSLSYMLYLVHLAWARFELKTPRLVLINKH